MIGSSIGMNKQLSIFRSIRILNFALVFYKDFIFFVKQYSNLLYIQKFNGTKFLEALETLIFHSMLTTGINLFQSKKKKKHEN